MIDTSKVKYRVTTMYKKRGYVQPEPQTFESWDDYVASGARCDSLKIQVLIPSRWGDIDTGSFSVDAYMHHSDDERLVDLRDDRTKWHLQRYESSVREQMGPSRGSVRQSIGISTLIIRNLEVVCVAVVVFGAWAIYQFTL